MANELIFDKVCTRATLFDAWRKINSKGKSGGIDGVSLAQFGQHLDKNLDELHALLVSRRYMPEPYRRIQVPKSTSPNEKRTLSLTTIADKIVQQAVRQHMEPIFEPLFRDVSFAYRPGRGPAQAIERASQLLTCAPDCWAACADIDNCFEGMDHDILLEAVRRHLNDEEILKLIAMWLKIGAVSAKGAYADTPFGIAQGSILSPLLSNIYLHPLDAYLEDKGYRYVRYSDNLILIDPQHDSLVQSFSAAKNFLERMLKLNFNREENYFFSRRQGFVFMGIAFKDDSRTIDPPRIQKMQSKLHDLARRFLLTENAKFFEKLQESVRGFENYYGRLLAPDEIYPRMNAALAQAVVDRIGGQKQSSQRPVKTEIRALLAPVDLFGHDEPADRSRWINEVADLCAERFDQKQKSDESPFVEEAASVKAKPKAEAGGKMVGAGQAEKEAVKAVRKQKARYQKLESVSRELIVDTPGTFLGKTARKVVVKRRGIKVLDFPLPHLETINVAAKGVTVSSDLIWHCCKEKVVLFFSDATGQPWAVLQQPLGGDATLGLLQLQALQDGPAAAHLAREFVEGKIRNQINLLKYYGRSRKDDPLFSQSLAETLPAMEHDFDSLAQVAAEERDYGSLRSRLMGLEADAARRYWQLVKILLARVVSDFPGRVHEGAKDLVNSLLNYGYGFLYRQVWRLVVGAGLNPKISFLHAPQGDKPTLLYDVVEEFRAQAVDRVVFSMLTKGERFRQEDKSGLIAKPSRDKLINALLERQGTAVAFRGEKVLLKNIIQRQVQLLCRHLRGEEDYQNFVAYY